MSFDDLVAHADRVAFTVLGGVTVTYAPADEYEPSVEIDGIFDEQYVLAKGEPEAGVESLGPAVFLRIEDLPVDLEEDEPTITIRGTDYQVTERRPDGMGGIVLALRRIV